jgi:hypothetical protein
MEDWASFFFIGSNVLPAVMVLVNENAFGLAIFVYIALLVAAIWSASRDEQAPINRAAANDFERRSRRRKGRD